MICYVKKIYNSYNNEDRKKVISEGELWSNILFLGTYLYLEEIFHKWVHTFPKWVCKKRENKTPKCSQKILYKTLSSMINQKKTYQTSKGSLHLIQQSLTFRAITMKKLLLKRNIFYSVLLYLEDNFVKMEGGGNA